MKLSDAFVSLLKEYALRPVARRVHPEDTTIYSLGLTDGVTLLAQELLEQLKPDVEVPPEVKESE